MFKYFLVILLIIPSLSFSQEEYSYNQIQLLKLARKHGERVGFPLILQAILLQETQAGKYGPVGDGGNSPYKRSYCPMQVKLVVVHHVYNKLNIPVTLTEEEIVTRLLTDNEFCMWVAAEYLNLLYNQFNNKDMAILAYNQGPTGAKLGRNPNDYVRKVKHKKENIILPLQSVIVSPRIYPEVRATTWLDRMYDYWRK